MSRSKSKLNKKSKQPFNVNRKSLLGILSMAYQEILDTLLSKSKSSTLPVLVVCFLLFVACI